MTFDQQLERAFDDLAGRLASEVAEQVRAASDDLVAAWRAAPRDLGSVVGASEGVSAAGAAAGRVAPADERALGERMAAATRGIGAAASLGGVLGALMDAAAREASRVALFLVRGDRIRGWRFAGFDVALSRAEDVEISLAEAGVILEAVHTRTMASSTRVDGQAVPAFAKLAAGERCVAIPLVMANDVVAVLYADHVVSTDDVLDVIASHAARCLEARTAIQFARALTEPKTTAAPVVGSEDDAAAERYARLLVSEIKLYHEGEVEAGRRAHDLSRRLGVHIERARGFYEQRVPSRARRGVNFFDAELVRTLAGGDARLLGVAHSGLEGT